MRSPTIWLILLVRACPLSVPSLILPSCFCSSWRTCVSISCPFSWSNCLRFFSYCLCSWGSSVLMCPHSSSSITLRPVGVGIRGYL